MQEGMAKAIDLTKEDFSGIIDRLFFRQVLEVYENVFAEERKFNLTGWEIAETKSFKDYVKWFAEHEADKDKLNEFKIYNECLGSDWNLFEALVISETCKELKKAEIKVEISEELRSFVGKFLGIFEDAKNNISEFESKMSEIQSRINTFVKENSEKIKESLIENFRKVGEKKQDEAKEINQNENTAEIGVKPEPETETGNEINQNENEEEKLQAQGENTAEIEVKPEPENETSQSENEEEKPQAQNENTAEIGVKPEPEPEPENETSQSENEEEKPQAQNENTAEIEVKPEPENETNQNENEGETGKPEQDENEGEAKGSKQDENNFKTKEEGNDNNGRETNAKPEHDDDSDGSSTEYSYSDDDSEGEKPQTQDENAGEIGGKTEPTETGNGIDKDENGREEYIEFIEEEEEPEYNSEEKILQVQNKNEDENKKWEMLFNAVKWCYMTFTAYKNHFTGFQKFNFDGWQIAKADSFEDYVKWFAVNKEDEDKLNEFKIGDEYLNDWNLFEVLVISETCKLEKVEISEELRSFVDKFLRTFEDAKNNINISESDKKEFGSKMSEVQNETNKFVKENCKKIKRSLIKNFGKVGETKQDEEKEINQDENEVKGLKRNKVGAVFSTIGLGGSIAVGVTIVLGVGALAALSGVGLILAGVAAATVGLISLGALIYNFVKIHRKRKSQKENSIKKENEIIERNKEEGKNPNKEFNENQTNFTTREIDINNEVPISIQGKDNEI